MKTEGSYKVCRLCAALIPAIYAACLLRYDIRYGERELPRYLLMIAGSLLAAAVWRKGIRQASARGSGEMGGFPERAGLWLPYAGAAFLLLLAGWCWSLIGTDPWTALRQSLVYAKEQLAMFFPLLLLAAGKGLGFDRKQKTNRDVFRVTAIYFFLVFAGIWFLEDVIILWEWEGTEWRAVETLILAGMAYLVFYREYARQLEGSGRKLLALGLPLLLYGTAAVFLVQKSLRLRAILYSLGIYLFDAAGSREDVGWLSYRLLAAERNWSGALQSGGWIRIGSEANEEIWFSWSRYPLSCIHAEYGKMVLLLLIVLLAAMLYSLLRIKWENSRLGSCVWYISVILIVSAVFAAGQEVFLIGTGVGLGNIVPLLGYGGWMCGIIWGLLDMKGGVVRSGIFDEADRKAA